MSLCDDKTRDNLYYECSTDFTQTNKFHSEIYIQITFPELSHLTIYLNKPILHPIFDCLHLMGMLKNHRKANVAIE